MPGERAAGRLGSLPGRLGVSVIIGAAVLGAAATVATGGQPGLLLGLFIVAGTLAAGLAVRARAVYLLIPVPALAYLVAAIAAGLAGGHAGSSHTAMALGAAQWIASGFLAMAAATALAIGITAVRWPRRGPRRADPPRYPPRYRPPAASAGRPGRREETGSPAARRRRPDHPGYPRSSW
jgi:hypothetical protein